MSQTHAAPLLEVTNLTKHFPVTAGFLVTALCASVFYQLFEKPFLNVPDDSQARPEVNSRTTQSVA